MITRQEFRAKGTTCSACERIITKQAKKVEGVKSVTFDYASEIGYVAYDDTQTDIESIFKSIEEKGYVCSASDSRYRGSTKKVMGTIFGIIGILIAGYFIFNLADGIQMPQLNQNMGYGLLFTVGLLTGFHCVSMCGGFVVSYTARAAQRGEKPHKSHTQYAVGKTISYTIIGAAFGLLGSIIAFTPTLRGAVGIIAGLFLLLFGLKMLNIFPILRKINLRTPKFVMRFVGKNSQKSSHPLVIGLLNGLMIACGPLQAIYIMAAGTGSAIEGAKLLFVFGLGTLPVMIGFGYFVSFVSNKVTAKILKASGVIVVILGLIMINNGLVLTGSGIDVQSFVTGVSASEGMLTGNVPLETNNGYQEIRMEVNRYGWSPDTFVLKKGVPVKWIIDGKEINGCNNAIQVPKYGLEFDIKPGEQIIEFTPDEAGNIRWSCWMGMIPGLFIVKDDIDVNNQLVVQEEMQKAPDLQGGSCGGSCGSPTCGAASGGSCGCGARR